MQQLKVSDNRRFLTYADGTPFFYLADTAWELFHRLDRDEADVYLQDRAAKRFTVIQAVVLAEWGGLTIPNPYGELPLFDNDPTRPNDAYFRHVDAIVDKAEALGLSVGMLPTWGDKWNRKWGDGPEIFTPDNARWYGRYVGRRYAEKPIIWILGGDRPVESGHHREIIREMALGLREGDGGTHLSSFHPVGGHTSAEWWHEDDWLDFNMLQSGHTRNQDNYDRVAADYAREPVKPCMDAEPGYEDHPAGFDLENGYLADYDVRKSLYWALFAGAFGHTYGCHDIWQYLQEGRNPATFARTPWRQALGLPGVGQVQHARALIESRPFLSRIPDQSLIVSDPGTGTHHVRATRDTDGSYALIYLPSCRPVTVDLEKLSGERLNVTWYDPRTGAVRAAGQVERAGQQEFVPPQVWPDWVLVLDDASRGFPLPGAWWPDVV
ncbi:MAG: glycoside hydrolase family 140 protein [Anaerolineae bacterium]|nr:glycoside hydrolase family 140 protein [Anaerolineae bacterium]